MLNIKSERIRAGLKQSDLANKLGVSIATVSRWERDSTIPDGDALIQMRKVFGCSIDYLLGQTEERRIA